MHARTPLLHSRPLSERLGIPVHLKLDALQPTGSFKLRGVGRAVERAVAQGARTIVSSSGGNAGLAAAYAARRAGIPAQVFVPLNAPVLMRERIAAEGAKVVVGGAVWDDAHAAALVAAAEPGAFYVPPFDHPDVWDGNATVVEELAADGMRPGTIVVAVGGGGLLAGILTGLERQGWGETRIVVAETEGAASFAAAWRAGQPVTLDAIKTIAHSLGAKRVAEGALALAKRFPVDLWTIPDARAVAACLKFADDHRILVEPSCGAALSAVYDRAPALLKGPGPVVVEVCGGAAVTRAMLEEWGKM